MHCSTSVRLLALAFVSLGIDGIVHSADPIKPDQFGKLQALIKPSAGEDKWAEIPWGTSLWEARKQAAKEGKPILLWEMDGHPLGCT
jgi:hypothetical protein